MIMNTHEQKIFLALFVLLAFSVSSSTKAQSSSTVTDPANDVTRVRTTEGNSGQVVINYQIVTDHPDIDILTASYTKNDNGSATLNLTVKGQIQLNIHTYYKIELIDNSSTNFFDLELYYSKIISVDFQDQTPNTKYLYRYSSTYAYGVMHPHVAGSNLIMTIEPNNLTTADNNLLNVTLPNVFVDNSTTSWHIATWQGNSTLDAFGDAYWDYFPQSDNHYTTLQPIPSTPGFELISILAIPVIIFLKKKNKF